MKHNYLKLATFSLTLLTAFLSQGRCEINTNYNLIENQLIIDDNRIEQISGTDQANVYFSTVTGNLTVEINTPNSNLTILVLNEKKEELKRLNFSKDSKCLEINSQCDTCTFYVEIVDSETKEEFIYKIIKTK